MANKTFTTPNSVLEYQRNKTQVIAQSPLTAPATAPAQNTPPKIAQSPLTAPAQNIPPKIAQSPLNIPGTAPAQNTLPKVVSVSNASATEGEQEVFTIGLSSTTKSPTTVSLKLAGETATLGKDFSRKIEASLDGGKTWQSVPRDGRFKVGVGVKDFQVRTQTLADKLAEGAEIFKLTATNRGGSASGTGTILDASAPVPTTPPVAPITPVTPPVTAPATPPVTAPAAPSLSPEAKAITDKGASAIHIDNDGDGLNTSGIKNGVKFDILNNGTPINTGWSNADDGLLVIDTNGNGKIDNGSELFGGGVGQGFAKLATFDTNKDGAVDAKDKDFGKLQIWNDRNQNGVTDPGELAFLKDANVASLKLGATNDFKTLNNGNLYGETSTAGTINGDKPFSLVEVYYPVESPTLAKPPTTAPTTPPATPPVTPPVTAPAAPSLSPEAKAITDKGASAIHIDNDGDGLNTSGIKNGVKFDILNNGTPINTGWSNADDGLLVIDTNGNGKIDNGSELFGGGVGEGFAKLATFDTNKDGVVDAKDKDFGKLQIWNDRNQNGVTDPGELAFLKDANVASLKLGATNDFKTLNNGNLYGETSTAGTINGDKPFSLVEVYYPVAAPSIV